MGRLVMVVVGLLLATVSVYAIGSALSGAPAFDVTSRQEGLFGDWRVPRTQALYNRADYLNQLAYAYVQADFLASDLTEAPDEIADFDVALARADRAVALLEESVALAPGLAKAWTNLGWAYAMQGDFASAERALETSWSLAPFNFAQAPARLALLEALVFEPDDPFLERPEVIQSILSDLATIQINSGALYDATLSTSPLLEEILEAFPDQS